ncbi:hypothetical protein VTK73DRAFT_5166 [Phialemonium thermophilum]|uniref:FeS cluster biogenesis domain-containing protein n=1 Tax=Phialemonium thermophilum TaxID=223376 RepID=A0ABR3XYR0_9PEZI
MTRTHCLNPPATAQLFICLSLRRWGREGNRVAKASEAATIPLLDVLLPKSGRSSLGVNHGVARGQDNTVRVAAAHSSVFLNGQTLAPFVPMSAKLYRSCAPRVPPTLPRAVDIGRTGRALFLPTHSHRGFSTTTAWRRTAAIYNPQKDDKGEDMLLEITPRAAKRLSQIMTKDSNPYLALRIQVESGGCHGFQYLMSLVTLPTELPTSSTATGTAEDDAVVRQDDTIFAYVEDDVDGQPEIAAAPKIILDQPSLELLKGSKVDFTMELIGSQFKIVDNPLATSSCGCGTSFDIKI